jgi:hypothetical protein
MAKLRSTLVSSGGLLLTCAVLLLGDIKLTPDPYAGEARGRCCGGGAILQACGSRGAILQACCSGGQDI